MDESRVAMAPEAGDLIPARLCREVAEVIERVCTAVAPASTWEVPDARELDVAEEALDAEARRLRQGIGDPEAWREALAAYESACFSTLGKRAHAEIRYA